MKNIGYSFNGFTTSRLKRFLTTGGQQFSFIEYEKNQFGEPTETVLSSKLILGVLHKFSAYSSLSSSQDDSAGTTKRSSLQTSIMTSWESLAPEFSGGKELLPGMSTTIGGVLYKIIKTENLDNWGIVAEISLEEYDGWQH